MNKKLLQYSYQLKKERSRKFFSVVLFALLLILFINLILSYVFFPVKQNSESMLPDVQEHSVILVSMLHKLPERGDVVLLQPRYKDTENGMFHKLLVKMVSFFTYQKIFINENQNFPGTTPKLRRVIGMPGDTIFMRDYVLYIKPEGEKHFLTEFEIVEEPYNVTFYVPPADWDTEIGVKGSFDEITLGYNEYFVFADNRKSSDDSRLWGAVKKDEIAAKVLMCYFPFRNFKLL